jgi:hypothetical protein
MTIAELSTTISAIVAAIPNAVYLRATDRDANVSIDNIDLAGKTVVIFNNLPEVRHAVSRSGFIVQTYPVELRVLQLAKLDDTTVDSDTIRDNCAAVANTLFDQISVDQSLPDTFEYSIVFLGEMKVYDKTMTGCRLSFVFNSNRTSYSC